MAISGSIRNVRISGIACAVPKKVVSNARFVESFGADQMAKFEKMVGIKERRFATDTSTADLSIAAAEVLRKELMWSAGDVDALIFVSQTPNHVIPATACDIQHLLGIKRDCVAYDINLGCSGFVYGIFVAASHLRMEGIRRVLLLGGDTVNKLVNQSDATSAPLFGEAGFAAVLDLDEEAREMRYAFMTDGGGAKAIEIQHGGWLRMDGMDVFNFTINQVPNLINEQIAAANLTADDIDYLVLHQANRFVLKNVGLATGFSTKKIPISMDRYGNTSTCSIPLTLCDMAIANPEMGNKTILMSGFGVGLSWGTIITKFDFSCCRGIVEI